MKPAFLAFAAMLSLPAAAQQASDLFSSLDSNGDGALSETEMRAARASGESWIALDRDQDGRIVPGEFRPVNEAVAKKPASRAYSAQRLIGAPVRYRGGAGVGEVHDVLVDASGKVNALIVETSRAGVQHVRVPWEDAHIAAGAAHIDIQSAAAASGAAAGGTRAEWRLSELLDDSVEVPGGSRYGRVRDLVIDAAGGVRTIVIDPQAAGAPGLYAAPWRAGRFDVDRGVHTLLPREADRLELFDYRALAPGNALIGQ